MEAVEHRDDLVAAVRLAVEPGELDDGFIRLGAAVAEEALGVEPAAFDQRLGEQSLRLHVPCVRDVDQLANLLADGGHDARRAMADQIAAPPREDIEIAFP